MAGQLAQESDLTRVVAVVRTDRREHFQGRLAAPARPGPGPTMSLQTPESVSKVLDGVSPIRLGRWRSGARPATGGVVRGRRRLAIEPRQHPVLPVDHVIEQFEERMRGAERSAARRRPVEAIEHRARGDVRVLAGQGAAGHGTRAGAVHGHPSEIVQPDEGLLTSPSSTGVSAARGDCPTEAPTRCRRRPRHTTRCALPVSSHAGICDRTGTVP